MTFLRRPKDVLKTSVSAGKGAFIISFEGSFPYKGSFHYKGAFIIMKGAFTISFHYKSGEVHNSASAYGMAVY